MLRIVPHTVPHLGRSYEHSPDGFELHLLPEGQTCLRMVAGERSERRDVSGELYPGPYPKAQGPSRTCNESKEEEEEDLFENGGRRAQRAARCVRGALVRAIPRRRVSAWCPAMRFRVQGAVVPRRARI